MKKHFLLLITSLFLLSGCSKSKSNETNVNNPYEIAKGTSKLSYYDTEDDINIDGFTILECTPSNISGLVDRDDNCIIANDGKIRCIYIVDEDIITYKGISVGDSIDKIEKCFNNEHQMNDDYMVLFNNNTEEDPINQSKEDNWIRIIYFTDGSEITLIKIYDVLYGRAFK